MLTLESHPGLRLHGKETNIRIMDDIVYIGCFSATLEAFDELVRQVNSKRSYGYCK